VRAYVYKFQVLPIHPPLGDFQTTTIPGLRSTNLAFPILHLSALPFSHDCSIDQVMEGGESVIHQLVVKGSTNPLRKWYCLLASLLTSSRA
jgi:hypothetical protein